MSLYRLKYGSFSRRENGVMRTYDARGKDNVVELSEEEYDLQPAKFERATTLQIDEFKPARVERDQNGNIESFTPAVMSPSVQGSAHESSWERISTMSAVSISVELAGVNNISDLDAIESVENAREGGPRAGVLKSVEKRRSQLES